jgi:hypothetical protein
MRSETTLPPPRKRGNWIDEAAEEEETARWVRAVPAGRPRVLDVPEASAMAGGWGRAREAGSETEAAGQGGGKDLAGCCGPPGFLEPSLPTTQRAPGHTDHMNIHSLCFLSLSFFLNKQILISFPN